MRTKAERLFLHYLIFNCPHNKVGLAALSLRIETALCLGCRSAGVSGLGFHSVFHSPCLMHPLFFLVPLRYYGTLLRGGTLFDLVLCGFCRVGSLGFCCSGQRQADAFFFLPYYRGISGTDFWRQNYEKKFIPQKNFYISKIFIGGGGGWKSTSYRMKNFSRPLTYCPFFPRFPRNNSPFRPPSGERQPRCRRRYRPSSRRGPPGPP